MKITRQTPNTHQQNADRNSFITETVSRVYDYFDAAKKLDSKFAFG